MWRERDGQPVYGIYIELEVWTNIHRHTHEDDELRKRRVFATPTKEQRDSFRCRGTRGNARSGSLLSPLLNRLQTYQNQPG
jgi:hypothetical protein